MSYHVPLIGMISELPDILDQFALLHNQRIFDSNSATHVVVRLGHMLQPSRSAIAQRCKSHSTSVNQWFKHD
jgi:hypothetical protein